MTIKPLKGNILDLKGSVKAKDKPIDFKKLNTVCVEYSGSLTILNAVSVSCNCSLSCETIGNDEGRMMDDASLYRF